jgi:hypothetical protein
MKIEYRVWVLDYLGTKHELVVKCEERDVSVITRQLERLGWTVKCFEPYREIA